MTVCNACGAHIDDWKHRTAFLCPGCYRKCPPKEMSVYEDAIAAFERFKKDEYRRSLIGMHPRTGQREKLLGRISRAWYAARAAIKGSPHLRVAS